MRVLIVDDYEVVRRGVRSLLQAHAGCDVCGEAVDGQDAIVKARELKPDVIVMDVSMPNLNGLEATRQIRRILPQSEVLILSQHETTEMVRQAFNAGALGYVVKSSIARDLLKALDTVGRHQVFHDPALLGTLNRSGHLDAEEILQRSVALEQALRESEELYRSTFELAAVGVAHTHPDGRWLRVNQKFCDIVGYSREELLGRTFEDLTHPDDLVADVAQAEKIRAGLADSYLTEKRYLRKDGSPVWVNLNVSSVRDSDGKLKHFIAVVEDISERKRSEEAHRQSEDRFRAFFHSSVVGAARADADTGRFLEVNQTLCRMTGYSQEELQSRTFLDITHPGDRESTLQGLELKRRHKPTNYEVDKRYVRKDGATIWVHVAVNLVFGQSGVPLYYVGVVSDITERKLAEQARRASEAHLEMALQASKAGFFEWDNATGMSKWSPQMSAIYGYSPAGDQISREEWLRLLHPDDRQRVLDYTLEARLKSQDYRSEFRILRPDGEVRWIYSQGCILRDKDQKCRGMVGTHIDITERKRVEEELRQSEERTRFSLEAANLGTWEWNLLTGRVHWSDNMESVHGQARGSFGGSFDSFLQGVHIDDREMIPRRVQEAISGSGKYHVEYRQYRADGTVGWMEGNGQVVYDSSGQPIRMIGACTDITARKHVEEALRRSEERLRAAFTRSYSFLMLLAPDGTILEVNQAALEAAGCEREQVLGLKFWERWWAGLPKEVATLKASVARAALGEAVREECCFCLPDGTPRFADRTLNPVRDENGHVVMIVATGLDVTEQKELRDQLEARVNQRTRQLEEKNLELTHQSRIVRDLSARLLQSQDEERRRIARELHDSAGQTLAALQMNLVPLEKPAQKLGSNMAKAVRESINLVHDLSKELRTISYLLHPPLLDEAGLPSAIRWYVEGFAERSKIAVELELPDDLGRLARDLETTVFRIVQECLTNIHRHSGSTKAGIRVTRSPGEVCVVIRDSGKGMPESQGQASSERIKEGVGIQGMRERVRQLGGHLEIQSDESGTVVTARVPSPSAPVPGVTSEGRKGAQQVLDQMTIGHVPKATALTEPTA